jgi:hypothetical protein
MKRKAIKPATRKAMPTLPRKARRKLPRRTRLCPEAMIHQDIFADGQFDRV